MPHQSVSYQSVWYQSVWYQSVWYQSVWYQSDWYQSVWYQSVWYQSVWYQSLHTSLFNPCPCVLVSVLQVAVEHLLKMKAVSPPADGGSGAQPGSAGGAVGYRASSPGLSPPPEPLSEAALGIASHLQAGGAGCPWEEWTPVPLPAMYCELYSFFGDSLAVRFSTGPGFGSSPPGPPARRGDARKEPCGPASNPDTARKMPQLTANLNISPRQDGSPRTDPPPPSLAATGPAR